MLSKLLQLAIPPWAKIAAIALPFLLLLAHDRYAVWQWKRNEAGWENEKLAYATFRTRIQDLTAQELAKQKEKAHAADINHDRELAEVRASADEYKRSHRVRIKAASGSSPAPASADPGVPKNPASDAIMVSEADFDACTEWVAFGIAAHEWAVSVVER